jgi:hypothetical protein
VCPRRSRGEAVDIEVPTSVHCEGSRA